MTQLIVDGFGTYGTAQDGTPRDDIMAAMLSGAWAATATTNVRRGLPWTSAENEACFLNCNFGYSSGIGSNARRVLPATLNEVVGSFRAAVDNLPSRNATAGVFTLRNGSNLSLWVLRMTTTGILELTNNNIVIASTQNPVIVAQATHHYEFKANTSTGTYQLYIDGTKVIDATGLTTTNPGPIAQFSLMDGISSVDPAGCTMYLTDLIIRSTTGSYNNSIMGDRRVATLMVNSDDLAHQGWTSRPIQRFGTGVLQQTSTGSTTGGISAAATTATNFGNGDFTLESQVRFDAIPVGAFYSHIAGKWQADNNNRSWQLYLAGPSLDSGMLVFQISTDGTNGTVNKLFRWPWVPDIGRWYHLAVARVSGVLRVFIDGIMQGTAITDANTYFAANAYTSIMCERGNINPVANTMMYGWLDEFRITTGVGRYTANFTPPSAAFDRGLADPSWSSVAWLSGFDAGIIDESSYARALSTFGGVLALAVYPGDRLGAYMTLNKLSPPYTRSFIEAALIPATSLFTLTGMPANAETVRVGTKDGVAAATYTWKTTLASAYDVLIGANETDCLNNLVAAILKGAGEGVTYGTGTLSNFNVIAEKMPTQQILVTCNVAGASGNAVVTTDTTANGSWVGGTLSGGADIPAFSQFGFQRPPNNTTVIDSVTLVQRAWKTDAGPAQMQQSFIGPAGAAAAGALWNVTTSPTLYHDMFELDPDTAAPVTPTTIISGKVKVNRTV